MRGNVALLERSKTAFLSSRRTPKMLLPRLAEWIVGLSPEADCVMCGNQSPVERTVFDLLLQNGIPTVLFLAETMHATWRDDIQAALDEGRLLVVTHCGTNVHKVSVRSAFDRNLLMLSLADRVVVGFCDKGGNIERALAGRTDIIYLQDYPGDAPEAYVDPFEMYEREDTGSVKVDFDPWERCMFTATGRITLGFGGTGDDKFVSIVRTEGHDEDGCQTGRICLGCSEFVKFCDVLAKVFYCIESGTTIGQDVYVASASGNITFDARHAGGDEEIVFTQTKDLKSMGMRRQTVAVGMKDALLFYDVLLEARRHFLGKDV